LKINKSGHSGTLDPKVTGCLPVAVGRSLMTTRQMIGEVKGIAVRSEQVFMKPGLYPKIDRV